MCTESDDERYLTVHDIGTPAEKRKKEKRLLRVQENQCVMGENKGKEGALRINVDVSHAGNGKYHLQNEGGRIVCGPEINSETMLLFRILGKGLGCVLIKSTLGFGKTQKG